MEAAFANMLHNQLGAIRHYHHFKQEPFRQRLRFYLYFAIHFANRLKGSPHYLEHKLDIQAARLRSHRLDTFR